MLNLTQLNVNTLHYYWEQLLTYDHEIVSPNASDKLISTPASPRIQGACIVF